jgi:biotin synthase
MFERMCLSMISHSESNDDTFTSEEVVRKIPETPVSILPNTTTLDSDEHVRMRDLGPDIFTLALGAVTPEIFDRSRGKDMDSSHR